MHCAMGDLLVEKTGGPSVFPYQPDGLWEELAGGANNGPYQQSSGEDLYRRSLYTYRKRTVSHPTTSTFDAPAWEICNIKRARTNTPLQSLALLNDTTYVEAARKFAERILSHEESGIESQLKFAFRVALSRLPTERELNNLTAGYNRYLEFYKTNQEVASQLLANGESPTNAELSPDALAAMTSTALVIMNLDETITKE
ncbi:MAG: DUF1553 domain-containing protein [Pirellulaceae bacterium]